MLREFSRKFVNYLAENNYNEEEIEQMEYVFRSTMFEILKVLGEVLIFNHIEDTQMKCFMCSLLISGGIILLSSQCDFTFIGNIIILIFCIFAIYNQAPIINPSMPLTRNELINKNRVRGLTASIFWSLTSIAISYYSSYFLIITLTIFVNSVLMFNKKETSNE
ncbi:putative agrB-like protein 1 [Clostridium sp. IBUN22A]|uniref:accessory gene regulator B family protein n=1 Tax=Clostridium sp. IBUN22A TaxID=1523155 RepID=UPI0005FAFFA0|nr:accessory gene regulator B family protein [Clostridium sp. IBUN22A]KJZ96209.1 putative agrB-like protein 1 [Clostridium sp. IBUN22A]